MILLTKWVGGLGGLGGAGGVGGAGGAGGGGAPRQEYRAPAGQRADYREYEGLIGWNYMNIIF